MCEEEKKVARKLIEAIDALPEKEQKYMEGLADGIALYKDANENLEKQSEKEGR